MVRIIIVDDRPQTTIATAQVFLHRFYIHHSFTKYPFEELVPALVFLASKVEEHPRKIRDVILANAGITTTQSVEDTALREASPEFVVAQNRLLHSERIILKGIYFDLAVTHPYKLALRLVKDIEDVSDELVNDAWLIINDSYRTTLCIRYPPRSIAVAAINLAAERKGIKIAHGNNTAEDEDILGCSRVTINSNKRAYMPSDS